MGGSARRTAPSLRRRISIGWISQAHTGAAAPKVAGAPPYVVSILLEEGPRMFSESRPADRRRRRGGHACPGAVAVAAAAVSSTTNAARHAGGAGSLRPRCAQILRFRPAGYDARTGMPAGQSPEDQRGLQPGAGQPRSVSPGAAGRVRSRESAASPFAPGPFFDSIGGVEAFPQTRCPAPETANGEEANHVH